MGDWNAAVYHRVSTPQHDWGIGVLQRLPLAGDELVVDVGCGTGRLTEKLADRLPEGHVIAVDASASMLQMAAEHLRPRFAKRVAFVRADAAALPFSRGADAVFSTATFHWVRDHDALFASLFAALKPGGRLVAQCGGGPNLEQVHHTCARLMGEPDFAPYFARWVDPWTFADADTTARRLERAGFVAIRTSVERSPVVHPDARSYREFVEHVICRPHLHYLPNASLRDRFMQRLTEEAAVAPTPFELDYWRLNIEAQRTSDPPGSQGVLGDLGA